jgi:hypothetical protein
MFNTADVLAWKIESEAARISPEAGQRARLLTRIDALEFELEQKRA